MKPNNFVHTGELLLLNSNFYRVQISLHSLYPLELFSFRVMFSDHAHLFVATAYFVSESCYAVVFLGKYYFITDKPFQHEQYTEEKREMRARQQHYYRVDFL